MHADMDMDNKNQENTVFYVMLPEEQTDHPNKRHDLQQAIQKLYSSHSVRGQVTVESGEGMSPPSTPGSPANNPNGTPSKTKRHSLPQLLLDEMSGSGAGSALSPKRRSSLPNSLPQAFLEEREERRKERQSREQMQLANNFDMDITSMSAAVDSPVLATAAPPSAPQESI